MWVPSYRVPCAGLIPPSGWGIQSQEEGDYCLVLSPIPGESQSKYNSRTIAATRDYISLKRNNWLEDMMKACGEARDAATIAGCHSLGK